MGYTHVHLLASCRTLPLGVMGGLTVVTLFYLLVNVAYIAVLGGPGMLESEAVAQVSRARVEHRARAHP